MAALPANTAVSDDGVLPGRNWRECLLLKMLLGWLWKYEAALDLVAVPSVVTRIGDTGRCHVPDVQICRRAGLMEEGMVPVAVIDILSPDDRASDVWERFRDWAGIGTRHIILMDPELYRAHKFEGGSLIETVFDGLTLESGQSVLPFDSNALFDRLRSFAQSK